MLIKITPKRQVTFPARVLNAMGVGPGDRLEFQEGPDGIRTLAFAPLRPGKAGNPGCCWEPRPRTR